MREYYDPEETGGVPPYPFWRNRLPPSRDMRSDPKDGEAEFLSWSVKNV
jgi:hypothetical protein